MLWYVRQRGHLPSLVEFQALAVQSGEVPQTGRAVVPLLDRFLPIGGVGGVAAAGVSALAIPVELAAVVVQRQDVRYQLPGGQVVVAPLLRKVPEPGIRPPPQAGARTGGRGELERERKRAGAGAGCGVRARGRARVSLSIDGRRR